jgi:hypothetical protein
MEAVITDRDVDTVEKEVGGIVERFGGDLVEWGPIEPGYVPFAWRFEKAGETR